jgi:hypothetical protein
MATVEVDPKYRPFVDELMRQFRARDLVLSDYARGLLYLSAEAWFQEPPLFRSNEQFQESKMEDLARQIVEFVFRDEHLQKGRKPSGHIKFFDLLTALSDSGKKVLKEYMKKGF